MMKRLADRLDGISPNEAAAIRQDRIVELLDQVRALAVAVLIAFLVVGATTTVAFAWLRAEGRAGREQDRVAICDLYRQVAIEAPPAFHCD